MTNKMPKGQYLGTWCQGVGQSDVPDFGLVIAFASQVLDACGQAVLAPRPYVTPFMSKKPVSLPKFDQYGHHLIGSFETILNCPFTKRAINMSHFCENSFLLIGDSLLRSFEGNESSSHSKCTFSD